MPRYNDNILAVENVKGRHYKISLLLHSRPKDSKDYIKYFQEITEDFVRQYRCKFVKIDDAYFNPFNETIILFFIVKEWKHPEKHKPVTKFDGYL